MLWTKMMFSLLFTKSITDLVEWLKCKVRVNIVSIGSLFEYLKSNLIFNTCVINRDALKTRHKR